MALTLLLQLLLVVLVDVAEMEGELLALVVEL